MADSKNKYRVYAGMDDSPPINWGTIANTISGQLQTIKKERQDARDAIDKATSDQMAELNKLPDVNNRSLSRILIEGSDRSKKELQMRMQLLKSGAIKPKDYALFMNEQKNGYAEFSTTVKNYDKWYQKKMDEIKAGDVSALDEANALSIEGFGNLNDKVIMTNPANGQLQVVTMGYNEETKKYDVMPNAEASPGSFAVPGSLNARMSFDEKKKKTSELVNNEVKFIGDEIRSRSLGNGVVETVDDFTQSDAFEPWKNATIEKLTSNDYDSTQILMEDSRYVIASSIEEARKKTGDDTLSEDSPFFIKMDQSGDRPVPKLTDDQRKAAKKMVDVSIESQIGRKEERTREFDNQDRINKNKKETASKSGRVDAFNKIFNPERSQDALNTIDTDSTYDNIQSIQMVDKEGNNVEKADYQNADSIIVQYYDPQRKEMVDGKIRVKDENGKVKSGEEIVMEMVIKSGIDAQDLTEYKEAFKKKGNKFNEFKGIENYQRKASVLKESGNIEVPLGKSSYPASQAISNVLKEDFKDDEGGLVALQELTKAKEEENAEKEDEADKKLDQYKWSQITNMVNAAFKPRLRGKAFEFNVASDGKLQVIYQSKPIDLGISKDGIGNDGARLMNIIEAKINNANNPSAGSGGMG